MMGLARGQLTPQKSLLSHLDHCLECRACEAVCPSVVPYGQLMDSMREQLSLRGRRKLPRITRRMLALLASSPGRLRRLGKLLYLYRRSGLQGLLRRLDFLLPPGLRRAHRLLPEVDKPGPEIRLHPADTRGPVRGRVSLFSGCASRLFDSQTRESAISLLTRLGYVVDIPPAQVCCGALHRHEGQRERSLALARQNLAAFGQGEQPILATASGCSSHLGEYVEVLGEEAAGFRTRVEDITAFLARAPWPEHLVFEPLSARVAVHEPCLQRNVLKQSASSYELLRHIPGLEVVPLAGNQACCGAAGSHMLSQPERADALLAPKLESLRDQAPDLLVTTNIGCALHIQAGLRRQGRPLEVIHPATLLARQLRTQ
jgi:glycolate oxidase iron-sulfur subunit